MINNFLFLLFFTTLVGQAQILDSVSAFYPFSGNSENGDGSGLNDLQTFGSPLLTEDRFGNTDCAYMFDGTSSTYLGLDSTALDFITTYTEGWSISLWYQGGNSDITDLETLFLQGEDSTICNQITLFDVNKPFVRVFKNSGVGTYEIWSDSDSNFNGSFMDSSIWHHLVVSVSSFNFINFYIDNELQDNSLISSNVYDYCNSPLFIGRNFSGKIDDIIIYNKPLDMAEVDTLYNLPSFCSSNPFSISELENNQIHSLFPNPVSDILTINAKEVNLKFNLVSSLGQIMTSGTLTELENKIDIRHIPNGIYFLNIGENNNESIKISIMH